MSFSLLIGNCSPDGANGGWSAPIDTSKGHLDDSSVKLHRTVSGGYYAHSNDWIPINNSEPTVYKFSGWVYLESSGYSWARLVLFMNENEEDSYYTEVNPSARVYTKNQWVYLEQEVTVPVNIDKINLRVDLYNNSPSVTAWFDELRIEKMESSEIVEENNYYPFGLEHKGYNNVTSANVNSVATKYGYNGKEKNDELGLQWMDYGARNYDASLGRWMNIDLFAEQMYSHSTYSYAFNNPIYFYDADGNIPLPQIISYTRLSSPFGLRLDPITGALNGNHAGLDLVAPIGSSVRSAARGKVVKVGWNVRKTKNGKTKGYGRYIVIQHADGYYTLYGHLEEHGTMVSVGDNVSNGQLIATSGNTGGSTGPHLHFEIVKSNSLEGVFQNANKVNPESIYDLDQKLHGRELPSLLSGTKTERSLYWMDFENRNSDLNTEAMYENEDLFEDSYGYMSPPAREREELSEIGITPSGLHEFDIPLPESDLRFPNNIPAQNQDYPINIPQRDSFWDRY